MPDDPNNPDVTPAPPWMWTGVISALLVFLEEIVLPQIVDWPDKPRWLVIVVAAAPATIRLIRQLMTGVKVSFRRAKPTA